MRAIYCHAELILDSSTDRRRMRCKKINIFIRIDRKVVNWDGVLYLWRIQTHLCSLTSCRGRYTGVRIKEGDE